jgi:hypothetical protein
MGVTVGVGRAWVPGTNVANFSGTTYSAQALYFALNDGPVTKTITAADPTNPRIDIVVLQVNDSQYSGATNDAEINVIPGAPAASPTAPTAPANSLVLAQVAVAANATSITNANITAAPPAATKPFAHMGPTSGAVALSTSPTTLTCAAQALRGGITFTGGNTLTVPIGGQYRVTVRGYATGAVAQYLHVAYKNGARIAGAESWYYKADGSKDYKDTAVITVPLNAGDAITLTAYLGSAVGGCSTYGTTGYDGAYLELEYVGA